MILVRKFYMFRLKKTSKNFEEYVKRYFSSRKEKILIPCSLGRLVLWETPEKLNIKWPVEKGTPEHLFIKYGLRMDWFSRCAIS